MATLITRDNLVRLADALISSHVSVVGPTARQGRFEYTRLAAGAEICPDDQFVVPALSLKEFFFPRTEPLFHYRYGDAGSVTLTSPTPAGQPPQVVVGARPCDAAALPVLDKVFAWDYVDRFYFARRDATTIVTVACAQAGPDCCCTSAGCAPDATDGSDVMLLPLAGGRYRVEILTEKGQKLIASQAALFGKSDSEEAAMIADVPVRFPADAVKPWLDSNFDHAFWNGLALKCLGCGTCAFLCPTCHCFDIVDEGDSAEGCRRRNWDACAACQFTLHASGHNPRERQDARYRQRIMHKFKYYVEKFGMVSCVGCGRCTRHCPVDMNLSAFLCAIAAMEARQ
jgi:ferredoxin